MCSLVIYCRMYVHYGLVSILLLYFLHMMFIFLFYFRVSFLLSFCLLLFFFFKQKTAYDWRISDWSSDVCSSDLREQRGRLPDASVIWLVEAADRTRRLILVGDLHLISSSVQNFTRAPIL